MSFWDCCWNLWRPKKCSIHIHVRKFIGNTHNKMSHASLLAVPQGRGWWSLYWSAVCSHVTYDSNFCEKDSITMWAAGTGREGRLWLLLVLFPSPSFFLLASSCFESCCSSSDGGSPKKFVPCCVLPASEVNVALLEIRFQHVFEGLLLAPSRALAFYQFRVKDLPRKTLVWPHGRSTWLDSWWWLRCWLNSFLVVCWHWFFCLSSWC